MDSIIMKLNCTKCKYGYNPKSEWTVTERSTETKLKLNLWYQMEPIYHYLELLWAEDSIQLDLVCW